MDFRITFKNAVVIANAYDGQMATRIAEQYRREFPEVGRIVKLELANGAQYVAREWSW